MVDSLKIKSYIQKKISFKHETFFEDLSCYACNKNAVYKCNLCEYSCMCGLQHKVGASEGNKKNLQLPF